MLKSSIIPVFSTFPTKPRIARFSYSTVTNVFTPCTPPVRRNASTNIATVVPPHKLPPTSAYIHLPFCRKRCHYCDFPIVALGASSNRIDDDPRVLNYVQLLCKEITATGVESKGHPPLQTVFFGGGTPSLVPPRLVSSILDVLRVKFGVSSDAEVSMEMDPGTFDAGKLEELMELGVNRVSLGVQAFQEELLKSCGRAHGVEEVYEAIEIVKSCGVENWSMDLISSLPHQTPEMWEQSLRLAIEAKPAHVSVYDLQVEQGTKFGVLYKPGELPLPSEMDSADFYIKASSMLSDAGYNHYEISSYCKSEFECKHNLTYWKNIPFYAFGLGAASYINGVRFSRPRKMKEYTGYVYDLENGIVGYDSEKDVDFKDMATDVVMLSLRTSRGLNLKCFGEEFGYSLVVALCKVYEPYVDSGHVLFLDDHRRAVTAEEIRTLLMNEGEIRNKIAYIRLSDPHGFLISNELISVAFQVIAP